MDETLIKRFFEASLKLFEQPTERKESYATSDEIGRYGWLGFDGERLNPEQPPDLKETFSYCPAHEMLQVWPAEDSFETLTKTMYAVFTDLCYRFLEVISCGLDLKADFLKNAHALIGQKGNRTALRNLYYPQMQETFAVEKNQIRLGEHTDNGTVTFLIQDDVGGLDMMIPGEGFVPATPIPGSVIVIAGSLLQRWTSDSLHAPEHRVLIPTEAGKRSVCRQSVAYFVNPDDDTVVRCLDGTDKYEPVTALDYLHYRAYDSFKYIK